MKINSSTDMFYQDTCGDATSHLQFGDCGSTRSSGSNAGRRPQKPHVRDCANQKEDGAGSRGREIVWGGSEGGAVHERPPYCYACLRCKARGRTAAREAAAACNIEVPARTFAGGILTRACTSSSLCKQMGGSPKGFSESPEVVGAGKGWSLT